MHNLETNTGYRGEASTICLVCATANRLRFMPCAEHFPAMPSELCEHNRTTTIYIENGTGIKCYDCDSVTYDN